MNVTTDPAMMLGSSRLGNSRRRIKRAEAKQKVTKK
jgi:hypothetical protein